jgi:hypothetical protein
LFPDIFERWIKETVHKMCGLLTFSQPGMTDPLPSTKDRGSCKVYVYLTFNLLNLKDLFNGNLLTLQQEKAQTARCAANKPLFSS